MEWNEEVIVRLRELWTEGHSTAEIGRRLGVSKNAIVGKAHRLELIARPSPIKRNGPAPEPQHRSAPLRGEGATLPPLASADLPPLQEITVGPRVDPVAVAVPEPVVSAQMIVPVEPVPVEPVMVPEAVVFIQRAAAAETPVQPVATPPVALSPVATPPIAVPPRAVFASPGSTRPVIVAPPRLQSTTPRSYGRVVTCCWPLGDPGTRAFRFCDGISEPGKPYCDEHAKLAYVKVRDRREDAA